MKSRFAGTLPLTLAGLFGLLGANLVEGITCRKADSYSANDLSVANYNLFESYIGAKNKWGANAYGTGATVTWSLMDTFFNTDYHSGMNYSLSSFMPSGFKAELLRAFEVWSAVASIDFVEVPDPGGAYDSSQALSSDIRIGGHSSLGRPLAHAYYPPPNGLSIAGDIHFDSSDPWKIGQAGIGYDIFSVALHEIGHSIGIAHSDQETATMWPFYQYNATGRLASDDIIAAQHLYGKRIERVSPTRPVPDRSTTLSLLSISLALLFIIWKSPASSRSPSQILSRHPELPPVL